MTSTEKQCAITAMPDDLTSTKVSFLDFISMKIFKVSLLYIVSLYVGISRDCVSFN